jgi:hypothetical protein
MTAESESNTISNNTSTPRRNDDQAAVDVDLDALQLDIRDNENNQDPDDDCVDYVFQNNGTKNSKSHKDQSFQEESPMQHNNALLRVLDGHFTEDDVKESRAAAMIEIASYKERTVKTVIAGTVSRCHNHCSKYSVFVSHQTSSQVYASLSPFSYTHTIRLLFQSHTSTILYDTNRSFTTYINNHTCRPASSRG